MNNHHHHHHLLSEVTPPVGSIIAFAGNVEKYNSTNKDSDPFTINPIESFGWMVCDGSPLSCSEYPELFGALGYLYGRSDDKTKFKLPNLSGQFLRGIGIDSASTENRIAAHGGQQNGIGSTQLDAIQTHEHVYNEPKGAMPGDKGLSAASISPNAYTGPPTNQETPSTVKVSQHETRPTNTFINYLIKYTCRLPGINPIF